jgi:hypothetical protein
VSLFSHQHPLSPEQLPPQERGFSGSLQRFTSAVHFSGSLQRFTSAVHFGGSLQRFTSAGAQQHQEVNVQSWQPCQRWIDSRWWGINHLPSLLVMAALPLALLTARMTALLHHCLAGLWCLLPPLLLPLLPFVPTAPLRYVVSWLNYLHCVFTDLLHPFSLAAC